MQPIVHEHRFSRAQFAVTNSAGEVVCKKILLRPRAHSFPCTIRLSDDNKLAQLSVCASRQALSFVRVLFYSKQFVFGLVAETSERADGQEKMLSTSLIKNKQTYLFLRLVSNKHV